MKLTITQLAKLATKKLGGNYTKSKLDYYANHGLLPVAEESDGWRRFNKKEALKRLKRIKYLQDVRRRTIGEIKELLK